jgi:hypothetical protein
MRYNVDLWRHYAVIAVSIYGGPEGGIGVGRKHAGVTPLNQAAASSRLTTCLPNWTRHSVVASGLLRGCPRWIETWPSV